MTKKHFIEIANHIKANHETFTPEALQTLCRAFAALNPQFKRDRFLDYITGECGPNGGTSHRKASP
jgi:hypothetical protein